MGRLFHDDEIHPDRSVTFRYQSPGATSVALSIDASAKPLAMTKMPRVCGRWRDRLLVDHNTSLFSQALLAEIIPRVEADYRVSARREDRAIAGLSMGGLESLTIGLTHPAQFAYIGGFSSAVHLLDPATQLAGVDAAKLRLLWIACGKDVQVDIVICRTHLAAFFWHLEHVFEALRTAVIRGQKEHPDLTYFWGYEERLDEIEQFTIRQEIKDYRNMGHQNLAIIGSKWNGEERLFASAAFSPTMSGHQHKEDIEMNTRLQQYFEFATNVWLEFAPGDFKEKFPRDFRFPVTVPYLFAGELPKELKGVPQLEVLGAIIQSAER